MSNFRNSNASNDEQNSSNDLTNGHQSDSQPEKSAEKTEASRQNGAKSLGPTSEAGKQQASQNAIRDGVFSQRMVIEKLGEKEEDFEKFKKLYSEFFQPSGVLEKQLTRDFADNLWKRARTRRAEELDLANRLEIAERQNELTHSDELEKLRRRFVTSFEDHLNGLNSQSLRFSPEFEEARRELLSTSAGVDFLLEAVDFLAGELEINKTLTAKQQMLLKAIEGAGNAVISATWLFSLT